MKLVLIGYMTSGKTTLGAQIAAHEQRSFIDLDDYIENRASKSVAEILREKGELVFRKTEREALLEVLKGEEGVIASGGGTPCYYDNMDAMLQAGFVVYLQWSIKTLVERIRKAREERPIFDGLADEDLAEFVAKHVFDRRPYYERAHHIVFCDGKSEDEIVNEIREAWKSH